MEPFKEIAHLGNKLLPIKIFITNLISSSCKYIPPHCHDFIEILYFLEGEAEVQINNSYYNIQKGEIVLLNSFDVHAIYGFSKYLVLQFETNIGAELNINFKNLFPFNDDDKVIIKDKKYIKYIERIRYYMEDIIEKYEEKNLGYELDIRGSIYKILAAIVGYSENKSSKVQFKKQKKIFKDLKNF